MSATWSEASSEVVSRAIRLLKEYHPALGSSEVNIGFLFRSEPSYSKGKPVWGQCAKVSDKLRPFLASDFIIWLAEDEYARLDDTRRDALIDHQLCHIAVNDNGGWRLRAHDVEEFNVILERYGPWTHDLVVAQDHLIQLPLGSTFGKAKGALVASVGQDEIEVVAGLPEL